MIDYQLPDISGDVLVARLRAQRPALALILLSGQLAVAEETLAMVDAAIVKGEGARKLLHHRKLRNSKRKVTDAQFQLQQDGTRSD